MLNRHPELKAFLKGGEAEEYEGVKVKYIHGRPAVMTIFENGDKKDSIKLYDLKNRDEMHNVMVEKGFRKKNSGAATGTKNLRERELDSESLQQLPAGMYLAFLGALVGISMFVKRRRRKR